MTHPLRGEQRLDELDFVKGTLVLLMVLYHWLNYFVGLDWSGYRYLRFLTPSFIFITGFLVSRTYLRRFVASEATFRRRLVTRGFKLLALFIALNFGAEQLFGPPPGVAIGDAMALLHRAQAIFIDGRGRAAFDILVSIAYFLIAAPFVAIAAARARVPLSLVALAAVLTVALYGARQPANPHLEMMAIAIVGMAAGNLDVHALDRRLRLCSVAALYAIYVVAIAFFDAPFPLQVIGVTLSLLLIYKAATSVGTSGVVQRLVIQMGRYSLLAYIVQIAVLQVLRRAIRGFPLDGAALAVPLVLTIISTVLAVEIARVLRRHSALADRLYRTAFP